jgi:hypothetical protein
MSKNTFYNVDGDDRSSPLFILLELTINNTAPNGQGDSLCITEQSSLYALTSVGNSNFLNQNYYVVVVRNGQAIARYNIFSWGGNDCYGFTPIDPTNMPNSYSQQDYIGFQNEIETYIRTDNVYIVPRRGCTNPNASNYNPFMMEDDGSCILHEEQINQYTIQGIAEDYWEFINEDCVCLEYLAATYYPSDELPDHEPYSDTTNPLPFDGGLSGSRMNFGGSGGGKFSNNNSDNLGRTNIIPDSNVVQGSGEYDDDNRCISVKQYLVDVLKITTAELQQFNLSSGSQTINALANSVYALVVLLATKCTGCMDSEALNYNPEAIFDSGNCQYDGDGEESTPNGCDDPAELANQLYEQYGCNYSQQTIYDKIEDCKIEPQSQIDSYYLQINTYLDNWCDITEVIDPPLEPQEDVEGCMDSSYDNYNPYATINVGCQNYDIDTTPTGNADNSDLYAGLLGLDGDYGNLIDDTILLIQNLQAAYEEALQTGGDTAALTAQLNDANAQLNEILSTDGLLNVISNAVIAAEDGNHDPAPLNAISSELVAAPNGQSGMQYITAINNALQTISNYANNTSDYGQISEELALALNTINSLNATNSSLQNQLEDALANQEDGITQADVDAIQSELDNLNSEYQTFLSNVSLYLGIADFDNYTLSPTDGSVQSTIANIGALANSYNQLATTLSILQSDTEDLAYTAAQYNALLEQYNAAMANQEDGITQDDVDAATAAATAAAISALNDAGLLTNSLEAQELEMALYNYTQNWVSENDLVTESDNMLSDAQLNSLIQQAIAEYIANFIAGTQANASLSSYIQDEIDAAVAAALAEITPEDGIGQADVDSAVAAAQAEAAEVLALVQADLDAAQAEIANLTNLLNDGAGTNAVSNETLQAAYDLIEQMEDAAEAQFQVYANDIAAYEDFLTGLNTSMSKLEAFLTENYGYTAYDSASIPSGVNLPTGLSGSGVFNAQPYVGSNLPDIPSFGGNFDEDATTGEVIDQVLGNNFSGGSIPIQDIYLNFAGRTIGVSRGFKQFKGVEPIKNRMRNANGTSTEATFELNENTKKILWGAGIVIFTLGAFQLIKSK